VDYRRIIERLIRKPAAGEVQADEALRGLLETKRKGRSRPTRSANWWDGWIRLRRRRWSPWQRWS
jgi:hypothetical protein